MKSREPKRSSYKFNPSDFDPIRKIALKFQGAEESISHEGTPSVKVNKKLLCRLHESGEFISIHIGFEHRDAFLEKYPEIFHIPENFKKYPYMAMWIPQTNVKLLNEVIEIAWKQLASKKQLTEWQLSNSRYQINSNGTL